MSEHISDIPLNVAQATPYMIYFSALSGWMITNDPWALGFFVAVLLLGEGMNHVEKFLAKRIVQSSGLDETLWARPNPPPTGCGIFEKCGAGGSKTWGFPSGHAQITTFAATFWTLYILKNPRVRWSKQHKAIIISLLWVIAIAVWYTRVKIGCHNVFQIAGGCAFGAGLGVAGYYIVDRIINQKKKKIIAINAV